MESPIAEAEFFSRGSGLESSCKPPLLSGIYKNGPPPVGHWWDIGSQNRPIIDNVEPQPRVPKTMIFLLLTVAGDC